MKIGYTCALPILNLLSVFTLKASLKRQLKILQTALWRIFMNTNRLLAISCWPLAMISYLFVLSLRFLFSSLFMSQKIQIVISYCYILESNAPCFFHSNNSYQDRLFFQK